MKIKIMDHDTLVALNGSSIRSGRSQNLRPHQVPATPRERYWINTHVMREREGHPEVRVCVVLSTYGGESAWLDISAEEFQAIPEIDVHVTEWETALCVGNPPHAP